MPRKGNGSSLVVAGVRVDDVLLWLLDNPVFTSKEIRVKFGLATWERDALMEWLLTNGVIRRLSRGVYALNSYWLSSMLYMATGKRVDEVVREWARRVATRSR